MNIDGKTLYHLIVYYVFACVLVGDLLFWKKKKGNLFGETFGDRMMLWLFSGTMGLIFLCLISIVSFIVTVAIKAW